MGSVKAKKLYMFSQKAVEGHGDSVDCGVRWFPCSRDLNNTKSGKRGTGKQGFQSREIDSGRWCILMRDLTVDAEEVRGNGGCGKCWCRIADPMTEVLCSEMHTGQWLLLAGALITTLCQMPSRNHVFSFGWGQGCFSRCGECFLLNGFVTVLGKHCLLCWMYSVWRNLIANNVPESCSNT